MCSANNRELFRRGEHLGWLADAACTNDKYIALLNPSDAAAEFAVSFQEMGLKGATCQGRDLLDRIDLGAFNGRFAAIINAHGAGLCRFSL